MDTTQPPPASPAPISVETATRSEISDLNDDDLLAFWLNASKEFHRLGWGSPEDFRSLGDLVQRRVQWSQTEMESRRQGKSSTTSTPSGDS